MQQNVLLCYYSNKICIITLAKKCMIFFGAILNGLYNQFFFHIINKIMLICILFKHTKRMWCIKINPVKTIIKICVA